VVDSCTATPDAAGIHVQLRSAGTVKRAHLVGARAYVPVEVGHVGDRVELTVPMLTTRWGNGPLALPSGSYRLELDDGTVRLQVAEDLPPLQLQHPLFRADVAIHTGDVTLQIGPPLTDDERSQRGQRRLERGYRRTNAPLEDAVFLESFYGKSAACNPLGIDASLAKLRPTTRRYWSVVDGSVAVPEGAIPVVEGSAAWWQARATSRVLVVNDWLRKRYRRHGGQHVLQTWHGTTLKRLARDRPDAGWRSRIAARREGARWDALLSQNEFSVPHLRSAYAFIGPVWVDGYPRNDVLAHPDRAAAVRTRLGIAAGAHVVLYAPTWREDRDTMIDALDPTVLASSLAPGGVVLVRGHSRTQPQGVRPPAPGVLDVTDYPDMADMLLVADVFVTDYSSSMFDWMPTGRPIIFFVPDLARYRDDLRGFYADLLAEPPGPVVSDVEGLIDAVRHAADRAPSYADVAAEWRQTYTPLDDGEAGRRVVERLVNEGWLD
jgi:CDP-glycerol glycerophosphotransferase (TagB/SpsB family)